MQSSGITLKYRDLLPLTLGLLLLVSSASILDLIVGAMPFTFGDVVWRFGVMRLALATATQAGLFVALFMIVGSLTENRLALRLTSIVAMVLGAAYLLMMPFFALDFIVYRRLIQVAQRHSADMQTGKTLLYVSLVAVALLWCGFQGVRQTVGSGLSGKRRTKGQGLVVGQDEEEAVAE